MLYDWIAVVICLGLAVMCMYERRWFKFWLLVVVLALYIAIAGYCHLHNIQPYQGGSGTQTRME